jgi:hypothetical protein
VSEIVPRHQWTHDGAEVLCVKFVERDGSSYGGFKWPLTVGAEVIAPDWNEKAECGGGLHGWPWGFSLGEGKSPVWEATWLVFGAQPDDVVDLDGKVKVRRAVVRYVGDWQGATVFVLAGQMAWAHHAAQGSAANTGDWSSAANTGDWSSAANTGDGSSAANTGHGSSAANTGHGSSAANTGDWSSAANTGDWSSAANTGDGSSAANTGHGSSAANTGDRSSAANTGHGSSAANTGDRSSAANTGDGSAAVVTGLYGRAKSGPYGVIALAWWNKAANRNEMRCARIGVGDGLDGTLKAHTWYQLNEAGEFVEDMA